jgi:hypothetical protein
VEQSQSIAELTKALVKVQGSLQGAKKDSDNPYFKSKYADLESVWDVCRKPLSENGLAVIQTTEPSESGVTVITTLAHVSGEFLRGKLHLVPVKPDPQGIGSAITYGRRYALAAIVGIYQTDDDGNAASGRDQKPAAMKEGKKAALEAMAKAKPYPATFKVKTLKVRGNDVIVRAYCSMRTTDVWVKVTGDPWTSRVLEQENKDVDFWVTETGDEYENLPILMAYAVNPNAEEKAQLINANKDNLVPILEAAVAKAAKK